MKRIISIILILNLCILLGACSVTINLPSGKKESAQDVKEEKTKATTQADTEKEPETETQAPSTQEKVPSPAGSTSGSSAGTTPAPSTGKDDTYLIPGSDKRYLTSHDLDGMSDQDLALARNEIYARHYRKFNEKVYQTYFNSKSWYQGLIEPEDFNEDVLNDYERSNIDFILEYEGGGYEESYDSGYYIIPGSDSRYISGSDLYGLSKKELCLARNEIYARHGRKFDSKDVREYFESQPWYYGYIDADKFNEEKELNKYEKANVKFILSYE